MQSTASLGPTYRPLPGTPGTRQSDTCATDATQPATLRPQKKRTVNAIITQPKDTYGLNLVPERARTCERLVAWDAWRMHVRTDDRCLVDQTEEPGHGGRGQRRLKTRPQRGRRGVDEASSPGLLLAEH